jgi:hypothetical protein
MRKEALLLDCGIEATDEMLVGPTASRFGE